MALTTAAVDNGATMPRKRELIEKFDLVEKDEDEDAVAFVDGAVMDVCIRTLIVSNGSINMLRMKPKTSNEKKESMTFLFPQNRFEK